MRIIGGRFRGARLAPAGRGRAATRIRPTTGRVRENVFNVLVNGAWGDRVDGVRAIDLFAGTGALGLEALSRGAASVLFVERSAQSCAVIRQNIRALGADREARLVRGDATRLGPCRFGPSGLAFLDPPYGRGLGAAAMRSAAAGGWLAEEAVVVLEEAGVQNPPAGFSTLDVRSYGTSFIHLFLWTG